MESYLRFLPQGIARGNLCATVIMLVIANRNKEERCHEM
jgi:hypothetical protein